MRTTRNPNSTVLVMAASTRTGSINQALARQITDHLHASATADLVDLREYPMPLYDGDLEARHGVPASATALAERVAGADALVIVSPEYNGSFSPLLKNTIDWVTRVDTTAFAHLRVLVASASPGGGGGANGAAMVRTWLSNMGIDTADRSLCVGQASIGDDGDVVGLDHTELDRFAHQAVSERSAA